MSDTDNAAPVRRATIAWRPLAKPSRCSTCTATVTEGVAASTVTETILGERVEHTIVFCVTCARAIGEARRGRPLGEGRTERMLVEGGAPRPWRR